jgi:nucleoside-triphosphatase THEP1
MMEQMAWRLQPTGGAHGLKLVELQPGSYTVGRSEDNDMVVACDAVSRRHARLELQARAGRVQDLGSSNGTFVNGKRAETAVVGPGDWISFGKEAVFQLQLGGDRIRETGDRLSVNGNRCGGVGNRGHTRQRGWIVAVVCVLLLVGVAGVLYGRPEVTNWFARGVNGSEIHGAAAVDPAEVVRRLRARQETARKEVLTLAQDRAFRQRLQTVADSSSKAGRYLDPASAGMQRVCAVVEKVADNYVGRRMLEKAGLSDMPDQVRRAGFLVRELTAQVNEAGSLAAGVEQGLGRYNMNHKDEELKAVSRLARSAVDKVGTLEDQISYCRRGLENVVAVVDRICNALPRKMSSTALKLRRLAEPIQGAADYVRGFESAVGVDRQRLRTLAKCGEPFGFE